LRQTLLEVAYIGTRGSHLGVSREFDAVPQEFLSTSPVRDQRIIDLLSAQVANPFFGIAEFAGTPLGNQRVSRGQLLRPYPHFTDIAANLPAGSSTYHSLQVSVEKRLSKGFTLQSAWTWSKFLEATAYLNDTDPAPERVVSSQDYPHRFVVSAIYELPVGKGKPLLGGAGGLLGQFVNGWQVQGMYEGQSGDALGFGNAIFYGNLHDIPIPVGQRRAERWFNTEAGFERDTARQLASNIRTFSSRFNGIRGDGINNMDLSMFKSVQIRERLKAQFRLEAYNALNHVQFANPVTSPTSTAFGTITGEKGHGQRQLNVAVKLIF
ncbi:MAG: hypothetical protein AAB654_12750, partial [Acidobacteriota bacterium]